jgi:hypothetical protein
MLVAAAALLSAVTGNLFGPRHDAECGPARGVAVAISANRNALKIEIGNGEGRLVVTVTKEVVTSITTSARATLLAAVDRDEIVRPSE